MQGLLNVHSENSLKDCALMIPEICKKASELGYEALALTDNGSMTGIVEFIREARSAGLKPVPGVTLYIKNGEMISELVAMAKDYTGYVGLCKAVSEANKNLIDGRPILDRSLLSAILGKRSDRSGHVFVTSGNHNGALSVCASERLRVRQAVSDIDERIIAAKHDAESNRGRLEELRKTEQALSQKVFELKKEKRTWENVQNIPLSEVEKNRNGQLPDEIVTRSEQTAIKKKNMSDKIRRASNNLKKVRDEIAKYENLSSDIKELEQEREALLSAAGSMTDEELYKKIRDTALWYKDEFGDDYLIEFMFHGREEEAVVAPFLIRLVRELGIRSVISNNVLTLDSSKEDVLRLHIIRSTKDNKWIPIEESSYQYYMKDIESLREYMIGFIPDDIIESSFKTMEWLFDECHFEWPSGDHYPKYKLKEGETSASEVLKKKASGNIRKLYRPGEWNDEQEERLNNELAVIDKTGYSDYTLIVADILEMARNGGTGEKVRYYAGPGRGSGAGSIVNYLTGITHIEPIRYGLFFERYLNIERVSPPDIDSDIATSTREWLVKQIIEKYTPYPDKIGVCSILTKHRLKPRAAIRAAGRVLSSRMYLNSSALYMKADRLAKLVSQDPKAVLSDFKDELYAAAEDEEDREMIDWAFLIEGCMSDYGTHAAGMIISDNGDITDYAPVINIGTQEDPSWNIQYDMVESESIGLLKMDILGLSTLDTISRTIQRIYKTKGIVVDVDHIPFEKEVFRDIYSAGNTKGIFQCESAGLTQMLKELKPDCIEDIIAGIALYRPGPMEYIPAYIKGKRNPGRVQYDTELLRPILEMTYGQIVYQEQVMRIVRDLAGYSMGRSDLVRRAMSKKKASVMAKERANFVYGNEEEGVKGCIANGISEETANKIYDDMVDFAKYAFNKAHSAAYSIVSYQTAYLKYHYPKEFLIETMNVEKPEKIPMYIEECRKYGFEVSGPDVNCSVEDFTEHDEKIIYGLGTVKGVKNNAASIVANRGSGYLSFQDYLLRSGAKSNATKALIKGGAFDCFCSSRTGLLQKFPELSDKAKRIKELEKRISVKTEKLLHASAEAEKKRIRTGIEKDQASLVLEQKAFYSVEINTAYPDKTADLMEMEQDVLFTNISVHPLDEYKQALGRYQCISSYSASDYAKTAGIVKNLRVFSRKSDQAKMAAFRLEDRTGSIQVVVYPDVYEKHREVFSEGAALAVYGKVREDTKDRDLLVLTANFAGFLSKNMKEILVETENESYWREIVFPSIKEYLVPIGHPLVIFDRALSKLFPTGLFVKKEIMETDILCRMMDNRL